jgi:hypothetical protein
VCACILKITNYGSGVTQYMKKRVTQHGEWPDFDHQSCHNGFLCIAMPNLSVKSILGFLHVPNFFHVIFNMLHDIRVVQNMEH